ncbi:hypothetical protein J6590_078178 [Homalodisca vitripennis]|nr:hypothetical protein J6590_078178 [Homalodisca vitripennis]
MSTIDVTFSLRFSHSRHGTADVTSSVMAPLRSTRCPWVDGQLTPLQETPLVCSAIYTIFTVCDKSSEKYECLMRRDQQDSVFQLVLHVTSPIEL